MSCTLRGQGANRVTLRDEQLGLLTDAALEIRCVRPRAVWYKGVEENHIAGLSGHGLPLHLIASLLRKCVCVSVVPAALGLQLRSHLRDLGPFGAEKALLVPAADNLQAAVLLAGWVDRDLHSVTACGSTDPGLVVRTCVRSRLRRPPVQRYEASGRRATSPPRGPGGARSPGRPAASG
jgi:hypothetical protein